MEPSRLFIATRAVKANVASLERRKNPRTPFVADPPTGYAISRFFEHLPRFRVMCTLLWPLDS